MKTNLDNLFKTNKGYEDEGVKMILAPGVSFTVARYHAKSKLLKEVMMKETKPYIHQINKGTLPEDKALEISVRIFVKGCVRGWEGIVIDGKEEEYSEEKCISLLVNRPDLFETLQAHASNLSNYLEETEELGNS